MAESAIVSSYDEIPYDSKPQSPTHPDCLATLATLLGMQPAPSERCRVLELGCADGGNLLALAQALPGSRFVGIDLSPRQVETGREVIRTAGLDNVELRATSILDVGEDFGTFDYVLCHGVYSWVPPAVQDKVLEICSRRLAPQGVAFISYNTYPGWHGRGMVREMLNYHVRRFEEPQVRVAQARAFLDFLVNSVRAKDGTHARLLKEEADFLRNTPDYYLFHEHLEDVNYPLYFHQFVERARAKGLQYLGESRWHSNLDVLPPEVRDTLEAISPDLIHLEQYLDFLNNRTFRRTLLCHTGLALDRTPSPDVLRGMHVSALARPTEGAKEAAPNERVRFTLEDGDTVSTEAPLVKAALFALDEVWPRALSFEGLWAAVRPRLRPPLPDESGRAILAEAMLRSFVTRAVDLHVCPPRFADRAGNRPFGSPLARFHALRGKRVPNLRHRSVMLEDFDRVVLAHLDGKRDRAALVGVLREAADNAPGDEALAAALEASLHRLAGWALLPA
jgi:methyltransferase-like protein/SAM-dependent methyltransferase